MRILMAFLCIFSIHASCETAVVNLLETFGDYFLHQPFEIDIKPDITSIASIKAEIKLQIRGVIRPNLVIIGYGEQGEAQNFFALSQNMSDTRPLAELFPDLIRHPNKKWYIYFVDKDISRYVTDKKPVHPSSAFAFLSAVGMQNLMWF